MGVTDPDRIPVSNAAADPSEIANVEQLVGVMRAGLASVFSAVEHDQDQLAHYQALAITAAAIVAGTIVGHMTFVGTMKPSDRKRAAKVVHVNFTNGIKFGQREAADAFARAGQIN